MFRTYLYFINDVIGGSGKSSLGKIASWLCKYGIFTIELVESYGKSEFQSDLKLIYSETGVKNQPTTFIFNDTQIVDDSFLKIINDILSTGEVTKLFHENEFEEVKFFFLYVLQKFKFYSYLTRIRVSIRLKTHY